MKIEETYLLHERGKIYAKIWSPSSTSSQNYAPIILLHDSLGCVDLWRNFPELLSEYVQRRVIAYDRLGHGRSHAAHEPISLNFISEEANNLSLVLDHFYIRQFVVIGHSVGGGIAVHCAAQYPNDCEAVVTISAQAFVEDKTLDGVRLARKIFSNPSQVERLKKYHGDKASWVLDSWLNTWLDYKFSDWSLFDTLPLVKARGLAIHGTEDEYGSVAHPEHIVNLSAGHFELMLMKNTAHFPHREHPLKILEAIKAFLSIS